VSIIAEAHNLISLTTQINV